LLAAIVTVFQLIQYSLRRADFPADMNVGGVPVGGLDPQAAAQRILEVYAAPVEIQYGGAVIHLDPVLVDFHVDVESMLAEADLQRTGAPFWAGFWDYLWNRQAQARQTPLVSSYSEERLRAYLENEVSARYDQPPTPAQPIPGTSSFTPGEPGQVLDIDRAVLLIEAALQSPDRRVVVLSSQRTAATRPSLQTLEILLRQIIDQSSFDGLVDLYFLDLQTGEKIHFAYQEGLNYTVRPVDISFTASSTIKIPIMVAVYDRLESQVDTETQSLLRNMIERSDNEASDDLMRYIDEVRGPLVVTETIQAMGLENTFLAGFFCDPLHPCPQLRSYSTPASSRLDIDTNPDTYNQTTPADMGMLLEDIYLCAERGGGSLVAAFAGRITQPACQQMIQLLQADQLGALIQGGVPEGTVVAHKHGWVSDLETGVLNHISDAGIVYTPGGNYVLAIYVYHPEQALWNLVAPMDAELSRAIYNYFNLPSE
jgi:beta-lactamase class A